MPLLGQGTWQMEGDDRRRALRALRRGIELGLTHVDTAEMYGGGRVERLVGEAIRGRRDAVFLASKVLPENASRRGVVAACERSLRRLGTDRLDLYLLHWPGPHPLEETLEGFEALRDAGKIRLYGVSNFDAPELREALRLAGPGRIACNQILHHPGERAAEHRVVPLCERSGVAPVAYSPLGSGRFPGPRSRAGRALAAVAAERGATPRQVALAFVLQRSKGFAIPKAAREEHVEENAGADGLVLEEAELRRLGRALPRGPRRPLAFL